MPDVFAALLVGVAGSLLASFPTAEVLARLFRRNEQQRVDTAVAATTLNATSAERLAVLAEQMEAAIAESRREVTESDEKRQRLEAEAADWQQRAVEAQALVQLTDQQTETIRRIVADAARDPLTVRLRWFVASVVGSAVLGAVLGVVLTAVFLE